MVTKGIITEITRYILLNFLYSGTSSTVSAILIIVLIKQVPILRAAVNLKIQSRLVWECIQESNNLQWKPMKSLYCGKNVGFIYVPRIGSRSVQKQNTRPGGKKVRSWVKNNTKNAETIQLRKSMGHQKTEYCILKGIPTPLCFIHFSFIWFHIASICMRFAQSAPQECVNHNCNIIYLSRKHKILSCRSISL